MPIVARSVHATEIPAARDAVGLNPTLRILKPIVVRASKNQTTGTAKRARMSPAWRRVPAARIGSWAAGSMYGVRGAEEALSTIGPLLIRKFTRPKAT